MKTKTHSAYPNPSVAKLDVPSARKGIFRKEGEYWTIGYGGHLFRLVLLMRNRSGIFRSNN